MNKNALLGVRRMWYMHTSLIWLTYSNISRGNTAFNLKKRRSAKRGIFLSKHKTMAKTWVYDDYVHFLLCLWDTVKLQTLKSPHGQPILHLRRMAKLVCYPKTSFSLTFWEYCSLSSVTLVKNYDLLMSSRVNLLTVTSLIWDQVLLTQILTSSASRNFSSASTISETVQWWLIHYTLELTWQNFIYVI